MTIDLAPLGYQQADAPRLWVRPDAEEFGYNDGDPHEMWVAQTVQDATDTSSRSRELETGIRDWPSRYHLSHQRANAVRPFLPTLRGPVLEVGAGTGAITRVLGEHGLDVVAVEGSPRRARICADRCRDLDNVRVVTDVIQGFRPESQFATVVVVGVLEYARMFGFEELGRDPVDLMLEHLAGYVAPGGQLLLAIENQVGLKYFAGFPEDHLGRRMFGVEDRYGRGTAVTFGRSELAGRLSGAGLDHQDWYFPFPDYKLPTVVLSERALTGDGRFDPLPLVSPTGRSDHQRPLTTSMDLVRAWGPVARNGLVPDLANSFIVRASRSPLDTGAELGWYFGSGARRPEFRKETVFVEDADKIVVRRTLAQPGLTPVVGPIALRLDDEPYRAEAPWTTHLHDLVGTPGWDASQISEWFGTWLAAFRDRAGLTPDAGDDVMVPGGLLDALPRNYLAGAGDFIDLEWVTSEPLPLGHVVLRALYDTLASLGPVATPGDGPHTVGSLLTRIATQHGFAVDDASLAVFWERERRFQAIVLGAPVDAEYGEVAAAEIAVVRDLDALVADAEAAKILRESNEALASERETLQQELTLLRADAEVLQQEVEARGQAHTAALSGANEALLRLNEAIAVSGRLAETEGALRRELELREHALQHEAASIEDARLRQAQLEREMSAVQSELEVARRQSAALVATFSWRVTRPLRGARRLAGMTRRGVARFAGRAIRGMSGPELTGEVTAQEVRVDGGARENDAELLVVSPGGPEDLDLGYYRARNDDLSSLPDDMLVEHFREHGAAEGRRGRSILDDARVHVRGSDGTLPTVLLVLHEATRTGAPVLGWNLVTALSERANVVAVLMQGGELVPEIERVAAATVVLADPGAWHPREAEIVAAGLVERFQPVYVVANSSATHPLAPALEGAGIPVVALVHEFASSMRPEGVLAGFYSELSEIVFPAEIVAESMRREYSALLARQHHILPQGQSQTPPGDLDHERPRSTPIGTDGVDADLPEQTLDGFLGSLDDETVLVIGAGTVSPRKGVEFFVQSADHLRRERPGVRVVFAWIGHRIPSLQWYVDELHEQVRRSGVGESVVFLHPVSDLEPLYSRADLFFLSSRLDPLPNVTIDAALAGIPVVAFEGASGFADWLRGDDELVELVVPHLDAAAAAELIAKVASDHDVRRRLGEQIHRAGGATFDMAVYARSIDALGRAAAERRGVEQTDLEQLAASGAFDCELYDGEAGTRPCEDAAAEYVHRSSLASPRSRPRTELLVRRPAAGFHPLVYAEQCPDYLESRDGDPFVDFLRRGRPDGPWSRRVIEPVALPDGSAGETSRVLVHGHFHYPELVDDLVRRIRLNARPVDLRITATSEEKVKEITHRLRDLDAERWQVDMVPNRGRDLAPLIHGLGAAVLREYDLVLHVHGKKSPHVSEDTADRWRTFLWETLVGGRAPMIDVICAAFAEDATLGLVSPEDPHLNDWDLNREHGEELARRFGLTRPLPNHIDFPMGAMFWARPAALSPILDARLELDEFPAEPLPIDATMLHGLERLVGLAAEEAGFTYAKSRVPGITR